MMVSYRFKYIIRKTLMVKIMNRKSVFNIRSIKKTSPFSSHFTNNLIILHKNLKHDEIIICILDDCKPITAHECFNAVEFNVYLYEDISVTKTTRYIYI